MLLLGAETHDVFNASAVVPAAVEDHDLAGRRKMREVALHIHLALLAIRGRRQGNDAKDARTDAFGDRSDGASLAGAVTSLEDNDHAHAIVLHPILKHAQLALKPAKFLLVPL